MSNIIKFPVKDENHGYDMEGDKVTAVWFDGGDKRITIPLDGDIVTEEIYFDSVSLDWFFINQKDLKHLMIMWLSMVDPEILNYDEMED